MPIAFALPGWGTPASRMQPLCDALQATGVDARPWPYDATGSIRRIGATLADAVADADNGAVHLVGHSLGGLAAASAVLDEGAAAASVTTVNSPWRGTWVAWTADAGDPLGHELRWGSDELARLRGALATHLGSPRGPRWGVVGTLGDLAAPVTTSVRVPDGARLTTRVVPANGHSLSLTSERMIDEVVDLVTRAT